MGLRALSLPTSSPYPSLFSLSLSISLSSLLFSLYISSSLSQSLSSPLSPLFPSISLSLRSLPLQAEQLYFYILLPRFFLHKNFHLVCFQKHCSAAPLLLPPFLKPLGAAEQGRHQHGDGGSFEAQSRESEQGVGPVRNQRPSWVRRVPPGRGCQGLRVRKVSKRREKVTLPGRSQPERGAVQREEGLPRSPISQACSASLPPPRPLPPSGPCQTLLRAKEGWEHLPKSTEVINVHRAPVMCLQRAWCWGEIRVEHNRQPSREDGRGAPL